MPYPQFLGIGAMKAGTSWLDSNLRKHPQIWMPPLKEIRYFEKGMLSRKPRKNIRRLTKLVQPSFRKVLLKNPLWMSRYLFGKQSDAWYSSLFKPKRNQICGEISPDYAKLDEETVKHIHDLMPDLKVIFFMRNPIDRAWSHILWDFCGGDGRHSLDSLELDACIKHAESASSKIRGSYSKTIEIWKEFYPDDQIFIGFFDEIKDKPEELLRRVERFLGVDEFIPESVMQKVNVTPGPKMPDELRRHLEKIYRAEIISLAERLGGCASEWLKCVQQA